MSEGEELERLRRENRSLDQQIKLLVKTEQRLYQSQNELDRQLTRIRALGEFALHSSSLEAPDQILERAVQLVRSSFHLDGCGTLCPEPGSDELAALHAWVVDRSPELVREAGALPPGTARFIAESGGDPDTLEVVAVLPLRTARERTIGVLLAWKGGASRTSWHAEVPGEVHLPFLGLLANHLERALQNAVLASDLTASNEQLSSSLDTLERTQQQLLQARKMEAIGRLAGGIAHDFNNLLTVIINHAELVRLGLAPDSRLHLDVERIVGASERAANITRQLLAFSRKEPRQPEVLDLNLVTGKTSHMLEGLVGENVGLDLDLDPRAGGVLADRSQVEQVLLNLVVNARDAMPAGGIVQITTRPARAEDVAACGSDASAADFVALVVADTGDGMDEETRAQIFEPFYTTKGAGKGTGLGLAMVYGAVRQNHGLIAVQSEPGEGATFTVLLPRARSGAAATTEATPERGGTTAATVLLAEDEENVRTVARLILEQRGHRVIEAENGDVALELGRAESVDVLVTDIVMPVLGGVELAQQLRQARPGLPVVYVSGYPFERLEIDALSSTEEFLSKPFTGEALAGAVTRVLAASRPVQG